MLPVIEEDSDSAENPENEQNNFPLPPTFETLCSLDDQASGIQENDNFRPRAPGTHNLAHYDQSNIARDKLHECNSDLSNIAETYHIGETESETPTRINNSVELANISSVTGLETIPHSPEGPTRQSSESESINEDCSEECDTESQDSDEIPSVNVLTKLNIESNYLGSTQDSGILILDDDTVGDNHSEMSDQRSDDNSHDDISTLQGTSNDKDDDLIEYRNRRFSKAPKSFGHRQQIMPDRRKLVDLKCPDHDLSRTYKVEEEMNKLGEYVI